MSSQLKVQTDIKITTSAMQRNWKLLKQIHVNDILDTMIEESLITIDASRNVLGKETESQQAEALLYLVFRKSQPYLDAFIAILAGNGYDFIVQKLQEDQAVEASNLLDPTLDDRRPKTSGHPLRRSDSGPFSVQRQLSDAVQSDKENATRKQIMDELKDELQQQQMECMQKQFELLKQHQAEVTARQTLELRKHNTDIIKAEFSKLKESEDQQKENEAKIERLETQLKALQSKLEQERTKTKKETKNLNDKIIELQRQRDELKVELTRAKREYTDSLKKVKQENLYLRNQIRHDKSSQNRDNRFTTPLNPKLAQTLEEVRNRRR
ncbi:myosin-9-like [Pecten maximus]|uniref:myosin-9-like n=1 Tax=Pecten maximus TaxID=6579 RepID=UPI00145833CE|nr:myosin-9-like [Pecten maximus]